MNKQSAVEYCEEKYPQTTQEFKNILDEMYETFVRNKGIRSGISVGTPLETEDDIVIPYIWFRKNDKIQRLLQLVVKGQPDEVGENIQDTYEDLSVYGVISQIVQRKNTK